MTATTLSPQTQDLALRELTDLEIDAVHGGDAWAGTPEGRTAPNAVSCANTILTWSSVGGSFGSIGGSFITFLGGFAIGGGMAAKFSQACNAAR